MGAGAHLLSAPAGPRALLQGWQVGVLPEGHQETLWGSFLNPRYGLVHVPVGRKAELAWDPACRKGSSGGWRAPWGCPQAAWLSVEEDLPTPVQGVGGRATPRRGWLVSGPFHKRCCPGGRGWAWGLQCDSTQMTAPQASTSPSEKGTAGDWAPAICGQQREDKDSASSRRGLQWC